MRFSSSSMRSSRWLPPMISPMPGLAVVVQAHIERLDLLRIVRDEHGALEDLLGEVTLMLGLKVDAPLDGVVELLAALL